MTNTDSATVWVAWTSVGTEAAAHSLADALVSSGCVACVQIQGPSASVYRWKGVVEHAQEWTLTMKLAREQWPELEKLLLELHPYEVPELIAVPVVKGHQPYLDWVQSSADGEQDPSAEEMN